MFSCVICTVQFFLFRPCLWFWLRCRGRVLFDVQGSVHRKYVPKYNQQDATLLSLFIFVICSTCFGWIPHPSSGAQNCTYSIWYLSNRYCYLSLSWKGWDSQPFHDSGRGIHPRHVEQITELNKMCNVASCWLYFGTEEYCLVGGMLPTFWWSLLPQFLGYENPQCK
jgi:hypothetical protein